MIKFVLAFALSLFCVKAFSQANESTGKDSSIVKLEVMPGFPGGQEGLNRYLIKHTKYPRAARKKKLERKVMVSFIITNSGKVDSVFVINAINDELDIAAVKVITDMPDWRPGMMNGKPVKVHYIIPINFRLTEED